MSDLLEWNDDKDFMDIRDLDSYTSSFIHTIKALYDKERCCSFHDALKEAFFHLEEFLNSYSSKEVFLKLDEKHQIHYEQVKKEIFIFKEKYQAAKTEEDERKLYFDLLLFLGRQIYFTFKTNRLSYENYSKTA